MSVEKNNEITVKVNGSFDEVIKILINSEFKITDEFSCEDIYFIPKEIDINKMPIRDIIKNAVIVRSVRKDKVLVFKKKEIDKDGNFHGWTLAIGGQMRRNFELYFSDVWQCTVSQTGEYLINTKPNKWVTAKCSLDIPKNPFPFNEYKDLIMKQLAD